MHGYEYTPPTPSESRNKPSGRQTDPRMHTHTLSTNASASSKAPRIASNACAMPALLRRAPSDVDASTAPGKGLALTTASTASRSRRLKLAQ